MDALPKAPEYHAPALHIDIESFSHTDLTKTGVFRYAEDPTTDIYSISYGESPDSVWVWLPYDIEDLDEEFVLALYARMKEPFIIDPEPPQMILDAEEYRAYNAQFEFVMLNGDPGKKINFPQTELEQWYCVAAKAAYMGLPRNLKGAAKAVDSPHLKDEEGRGKMLQLAKPRKPSKKDPHPRWRMLPQYADKYIAAYHYNADDTRAEAALDKILPELPRRERELYLLDQRINARGIMVDIPGVNNAKSVRDQYKENLAVACDLITGGIQPTQTSKLTEWINQDYPLPNLQAETIRDVLRDDDDIPAHIDKVLRIRRSHEMKAPSKLDSMLRAVCHDDTLRGMFLYYAAGTGRWASRLVQLQNLFRSCIDDPENALRFMEARDVKYIRSMYDDEDVMRVVASIIRSLLIARPGKVLLCADYVSIEARVVAWLAGQKDKLQMFRDHGKAYEYMGARIYNLPTDLDFLMTMKQTHPDERFAGKTSELACSYQGGVAALQKMAEKEGVRLSDELCEQIKSDWRSSNRMIEKLWYKLEECAKAAVLNPGTTYVYKKLKFEVHGKYLYMRLPSGRKLAYYKPRVDSYGKVSYLGVNTYTRQWGRVDAYGGRWTENATQATARDVMAYRMYAVERAGYPLLGTVHDEIITEPDDSILIGDPDGEDAIAEVTSILCDLPEWADGLPVKADGFVSKRYKKD